MDEGIKFRRKYRGVVGIDAKLPVRDRKTLSLVYTPGVARPCLEIAKDFRHSFEYTLRGNTIAVVSDGSSVHGLRNVGSYAAIPMLESKCVFHKTFAGLDAFPIAIDTQNIDEFVETIRYLSPTFGGFHLEDISSPRCFAILERLKRSITLPILHADQDGAAVAVVAALKNALKVVDKKMKDIKIVVNGAGAAGITTSKMLKRLGVGEIQVCDRHGVIYYRRLNGLNWVKSELANIVNPDDVSGTLEDVIKGADVFIGFSAKGTLTPAMIKTMAKDPIVFALALPEPEIDYATAKEAGARIVCTGRSDFPNQINSSLVVPGIFRGAMDVRSSRIDHHMFVAAADAYANLVTDPELSPENVVPKALDYRATAKIARFVAQTAQDLGLAHEECSPDRVEERVMSYVYEGTNAWIDQPAKGIEHESLEDQALELRRRYHGVIETKAHVPIRDHFIYSQVYSAPEAAKPCALVRDNPEEVYELTCKNNLVAIVSDGSAVLGLGNIGPHAAIPVMEGKAVLFKTFGGAEAFPICLRTQDVDEFVQAVINIAPVFGGINLEDIAAPRCFEIEQKLTEALDIPVFHDDQHGTAVVTLAAVINACKATGRNLSNVRIAMNGAGAAALSVCQLLMSAGVEDVIICDTKGAIYKGRKEGMNPFKNKIAEITNLKKMKGDLNKAIEGTDIFIGLSVPGTLTGDMIKTMAPDPIILALANPTPEIMPDEAYAAGAKIVATGRSDFPNQVNNSLAFPGIFRGALDVRARHINMDMKTAAAHAIANMMTEEELAKGTIIPEALDFRVPPAVAAAVAQSAMDSGVARKKMDPDNVQSGLKNYIYEGHLDKISQ